MAHRYALGIDVGTTGVKVLLVDGEGRQVADVLAEHDLSSPHAGWAEEDASVWWHGAVQATRQALASAAVDPRDIVAVGVSGMVPAIVLLDEANQPLRPTIQQNDARAVTELEEVSRNLNQEEVYRRCGSYTNSQHVLPRLLWVQRHEPFVWQRVRWVMGSYDYITLQLTGRHSLEMNWAVESGLYDIREQAWIPEYLGAGQLSPFLFPPVRRPTEVVGEVSAAAAALTGLAVGTPVVAGSADHVASALAAGLRQRSDLLIKFGGAGDVLYCVDGLETHPKLFIDYHDIPGQYLINGCMAASGSLVKWFVRNFASGTSYGELDAAAEQVGPGSDGLIVLPYFIGEKTPLFDPLARGVFFGLSLHHGQGHLFRACLEAVIYGFRHHVDVLRDMGHEPKRVFATNGGVKSRLWRQIAADVLGTPVVSFPGHPGSALGVAFVAGKAGGLFTSWEDIDRFLKDGHSNVPDPDAHRVYTAAYHVYRQIYQDLKHTFPLLQQVGRTGGN